MRRDECPPRSVAVGAGRSRRGTTRRCWKPRGVPGEPPGRDRPRHLRAARAHGCRRPDHERSARALTEGRAPFVVPAAILGEAGCLIEAKLGPGALLGFVGDLIALDFVLDCGEDDFEAIGALLERYRDLRLGLADAGVMACAERRRAPVLTLDFRDFAPVAREGRIQLALDG